MMTVLHSLKEMTPDWLTRALREKGVLENGQVRSVKSIQTNHQASLNHILSVKYSTDATKTAPKTLFLKLSRPERLPLTASEVEYYTKILAQTPYKIAPVCYSAEFESETGAYHILLEDVSATHTGISMTYPPVSAHAISMAKTLARLHAHWWENPAVKTVADWPTEAVINRYVQFCLAGLSPMLDFIGDRITPAQRDFVKALAERFPRWMVARTQQQPNHLTLIHGDSHNGNFLLPKTEGETYLIDRQPFDWSLTCWLGISDLTYMMVHWWYPSHRQRVEESVLRAYHQELQLRGVKNYTWDQLWQDYRLCAIQSLFVPLAWCAYGSIEQSSWAWVPKLVYTLEAIEYLHSGDVLNHALQAT